MDKVSANTLLQNYFLRYQHRVQDEDLEGAANALIDAQRVINHQVRFDPSLYDVKDKIDDLLVETRSSPALRSSGYGKTVADLSAKVEEIAADPKIGDFPLFGALPRDITKEEDPEEAQPAEAATEPESDADADADDDDDEEALSGERVLRTAHEVFTRKEEAEEFCDDLESRGATSIELETITDNSHRVHWDVSHDMAEELAGAGEVDAKRYAKMSVAAIHDAIQKDDARAVRKIQDREYDVKELARLRQAKQPAQRAIEVGKRGGKFYTIAGGKKVYVKE